jgi:hypothetical protein
VYTVYFYNLVRIFARSLRQSQFLLLLGPEYEGDMFIRNVALSPNYVVCYNRDHRALPSRNFKFIHCSSVQVKVKLFVCCGDRAPRIPWTALGTILTTGLLGSRAGLDTMLKTFLPPPGMDPRLSDHPVLSLVAALM